MEEASFSDQSLIQKAELSQNDLTDVDQEIKITEYLEQIATLREQMAKLKQTQQFLGFE